MSQVTVEEPRDTIGEPATPVTRQLGWLRIILRLAVDLLLINLAFILAYQARYSWQIGRDVTGENLVDLDQYLPVQVFFVAALMLVLIAKGLYRLPRGTSWLDEMQHIASSTIIATAIVIVLVFYVRPLSSSRLIYIYFCVATLLVFGIERALTAFVRQRLRRRGIGVCRALVVGSGTAGWRLMQNVIERPNLGYYLIGYLADGSAAPEWTRPLSLLRRDGGADIPVLGDLGDLARVVRDHDIDEVMIAMPATSHEQIVAVIDHCRDQRVSFKVVPDFFEMSFQQVSLDTVNDVPLIGVKDASIRGWNLAVKRGLDILLSLLVLVLVGWWLMPLLALAIRLDSPGPVFFRQTRVGKGGRLFTLYKFRSMCQNAEQELADLLSRSDVEGIYFKMHADPRCTRVGRLLRSTSLDELPQLFNILRGHMSWVGPRPPVPDEVDRYADWHRKRLEITPGLTGLWQVSGRSSLSFDEMVKLDLYYAENWSLWLDIKVLLRTGPAVLTGKGAY